MVASGISKKTGYSEDCIFCRIVKGREEASVVVREDNAVAFMDIRPVNPGHVLVVPRNHASKLSELDGEVGGQVFRLGMRIAQALRDSDVRCEGVNLLVSDGRAAGQVVFHVHLHVIPRFSGDGFSFRRGRGSGGSATRKELDGLADRIRHALS